MDITTKREAIRSELLLQRQQLSTVERATRSKQIANHVMEWMHHTDKNVEESSFNAIMVYLSVKSEVETYELIETFLNQGKQVIAPAINAEKIQLIPQQIQNVKSDLIQHRFGMLQPQASCPIFPIDQLQLVLVPGIAFDSNGYRIGYGIGFYDRFLPTCPNAVTIGIAYQLQIVEDTLPQSWDVPVQHIFTENGML